MRTTYFRTLAFSGAGLAILIAVAGGRVALAEHENDHFDHFRPGNLVVSRSVYGGDASTVTVGQTLPPGCVPGNVTVVGSSTKVAVTCETAGFDGTYPTVFDNNTIDGSFGVTSPIYLDQVTTYGEFINTLAIDPTQIVTSFSSKSELALHLSDDRRSITFVGYRGGSGYPTAPNELDVSNSNTPGVVDPTNPVVSQYYRAVAEVDDDGHLQITEGNAYSGNNGRSAIKSGGLYYMAGNDNNGGLTKTQLASSAVPIGQALVHSTGAELLVPGAPAPVPPNIDMLGYFTIPGDKAGKDTNFRGVTIFNNTLFVTKGSGGNGINTVYQVGATGTLPSPTVNGGNLGLPITILPGFWTATAGTIVPGTATTPPQPRFPFGIWFANATTLYVADEGDGTMADAGTDTGSGLEKWIFNGTTWQLVYTLQAGLDLGVPYTVYTPPGQQPYPMPASDGLRNITGRVNRDGRVTIWAVTSTVSTGGDQGADPNKLVMITDDLAATTLPAHEQFRTIRHARYGEVLRGVSFTPGTEFASCGERRDGEEECDDRR